ncbi:murein biosynthesis integral membrane protein MurJ [Shewanella fidelis]|uniref:Probable lipid II flippase MurJ n=1 Tax=Shewanella fidelis TaxID=173509 RepID=A0AAW8NNI4_9GAMM|nr:murein biosynthesis integral membrane protein MurJ [Shewanella fidelis]MDR8524732.1 murein biosynthesis integral membrane protein MurJ [Shewanella fidelis]MDW4810803.1 murein biosynthesis integral membrane protein MurJ [Shewanella fidelis]MDW4815418.1 murein biosynthesis integral membrane protein MurJ [Shewanella fidelis]MDW4819508.1 murein biosynthesis integral membrane protein MurJ [Shewanella fidelis]MDW4822814.1 murein biosynthesis integral membrane protein MurJ [Shewanella fidelis]
MSKKLMKSGIIVSAMTLISRVLGLVRDVVIANLMGAGSSADVFFFANKIPNFLRRLFAEGAFAQAFVPVLTEYQEKNTRAEVNELIAKVAGTLGVLVSIVTLVGVIASPVLTALFGGGWFLAWVNDEPNGEKFELASLMLKITFPYLWFITFTALAGSILNTRGRFAVSAFTPVFLNIAIISAAIFLSPNMEQPEIGLACGVFLGGLIQFLFQIPFLMQEKALVKPSWGWNHPGVVKIRTLMIPALFGVSVSQINLLLDTFIASFLVTGSISWLYYSDRLLEFPLGLFGIAIATVILPALSKRHVNAESGEFAKTMDWGVKAIVLLGLPAMCGLIILAKPMLMVLFMRGAFGYDDVEMASYSLMAYGSGLLSFMMIKILAPGYYSRQDTKTPVRYGIIAMVSNMVFNLIFAIPFGYVGLAIATSMSALLNAFLLYRGLHKANVYRFNKGTLLFFAKASVAAAVMVMVIFHFDPDISQWLDFSFIERSYTLAKLIVFAAVAYFICLVLLGIRPWKMKAAA